MDETKAYGNRHALEYEQIYHRDEPVRQAELAAMSDAIKAKFTGRRVLEVACGTGYWTAILAPVAGYIAGVDASQAMLEIARAKQLPTGKVDFLLGDAYALDNVPGDFNAALANFWLSHIPHV